MASIGDVFKIEAGRRNPDAPEKLFDVYIFIDGDWCHTYNWSTWLFTNFVYSEEAVREVSGEQQEFNALNVFRNELPSGSPKYYAFAGFPANAISKFFNGHQYGLLRDDCMRISVNPDTVSKIISMRKDVVMTELNYDVMKAEYDAWFETLRINEKKQKKSVQVNVPVPQNPTSDTQPESNKAMLSPMTFMEVFSKVIKYPIENKTLQENTAFLFEIKSDILKLMF